MFINKRQLTYSNHKSYFSTVIEVCREHKRFKPASDKPLPLLSFKVGWLFFRLCLLPWSSFRLLKSLFHRYLDITLPVATADSKQFDFKNGFNAYENQTRTIIH